MEIKITLRQYKELKKLHKLIIHQQERIKDDKEWYRLARKETRQVERGGWSKYGNLCQQGCGF